LQNSFIRHSRLTAGRMRLCRNRRKQLQNCHTGEYPEGHASQYPEDTKVTGFPRVKTRQAQSRAEFILSAVEWLARNDKKVIMTQSRMPGDPESREYLIMLDYSSRLFSGGQLSELSITDCKDGPTQ
jgi:hypothetical protein